MEMDRLTFDDDDMHDPVPAVLPIMRHAEASTQTKKIMVDVETQTGHHGAYTVSTAHRIASCLVY